MTRLDSAGLDYGFLLTPYFHRVLIAGFALADKVAAQTATSGAYRAAKNLRKAGYTLDVALCLVARRMPA